MPELRRITLGALFDETCRRFENQTAVEYRGRRLSYGELDAWTDRIARGLLALGLGRGSRAALWGNDRPNTLACFLALEKLGAVAVMLGTSLGEEELRHQLTLSGAELLICDDGFRETRFPAVARRLEPRGRRVYIGEGEEEGFLSLAALEAEGEAVPPEALAAAKAAVLPEDPDMILFTSGTTSASKGVLTTHFSRANTALLHIQAMRADERDKFCVAIPMFHCFSMTANILSALFSGACLYFPENRRTRTLFNAIERDRVTVLHAVPTLYSAMLARNHAEDFDLSSLRVGVIGGSVYTPAFFEEVERALGFRLLSSLGQTEATAGYTFCGYEEPLAIRAGSVGRFIEHTEGKIRSVATGETLPPGQEGEICMRGFSVMQGYVGNPEATAAALEDGWLRTGDMGFIDGEGRLHITGRLKELIIRGGENISPGEIEALFEADPAIREVKAVAVPDAHYGEEICLCVVPAPGARPEPEALRERVAARLAYFKVPRYVVMMDTLPRTSSGKLALGRLREQARAALGL